MKQPYFIKDLLTRFRKSDISIFHDFAPPPTGGGHQFMRALQQCFMNNNYLVENNTISPSTKACLFNSFNFNFKRLQAKKKSRPSCKMIHRVDGPIATYRGIDDGTDKLIRDWNTELADLTVFQSHYSLQEHEKLGLSLIRPHVVIPNTPDPLLFNSFSKAPFQPDRKIRLVSTSWSDNPNKGLEIYQWLDQNLDWDRYEYTFIGRIQTTLKNIKHIQPVKSTKVADYLKYSDIYITASRHDPCSNSLLEALACGLPALYLDSGGHEELVNKAGLPFSEPGQIPELLGQLVEKYAEHQRAINISSMDEIARRYIEVMELKNE